MTFVCFVIWFQLSFLCIFTKVFLAQPYDTDGTVSVHLFVEVLKVS